MHIGSFQILLHQLMMTLSLDLNDILILEFVAIHIKSYLKNSLTLLLRERNEEKDYAKI